MIGKVKTLSARLLVKRCVSCGYDGALLRGGQARRCARCGCDLQQRPPRSYAEMEGLLGQPLTFEPPLIDDYRDDSLIHRWLAFIFLMMIAMVAIAYLSAAAMPV